MTYTEFLRKVVRHLEREGHCSGDTTGHGYGHCTY